MNTQNSPVCIVMSESERDVLARYGMTALVVDPESIASRDWSDLVGSRCWLLPRADAVGVVWAKAITRAMLAKFPWPETIVVHLPRIWVDCPSGATIVDYVAAFSPTPDRLRWEIREAASCSPDGTGIVIRDGGAQHAKC